MRSAMKVWFYVCLLAALASRAGSQSSPAATVSTVQGQVRLPASSFSGLFHLRLEQQGRTLQEQSSPDGAFRFENVARGSYILVIEAPGYPPVFTPVDVPGRRFLDLDLAPAAPSVPANQLVASVSDYQVSGAARKQFERAEKKLRAGDCSAAVAPLRKALRISESYAAAHNALGTCYVQLNQPQRAEQEFRSALAETSAAYPALNLSDLYLREGRMTDAEVVLAAAVDRNPQDGDVYYALALLRLAQNRFAEAEKLAHAAHFYRSHTADAHLLLAKIYVREGKTEDALIRPQLQLYVDEAQPGPVRDQIRAMLEGTIQRKEK